jgi:hypothetical protein
LRLVAQSGIVELTMSEVIYLEDGVYRTPMIGVGSERDFPDASFFVEGEELGINSALFGDKKLFSELFPDPRAAALVDAVVRHQFHHLDTRQLSLPECFETRSGAGRMDRLTTLVESARLAAGLGATFEQVTQIMFSDINVTVGSHRLGDHLAGDYTMQSTRDDDIVDYAERSSLKDYLVSRNLVSSQGFLAGSSTTLETLSNPNYPRRYDLVEAPRPDSNADRDPFTLIEGLYLYEPKLIREAVRSIVRAEIPTQDGGTEERLAYTSLDAAELLFRISVRHATEHWGNPEHHLIEEVVSTADKHRLLYLMPYSPIDYVRTSESEWFGTAEHDEFALGLLEVAKSLAKTVRDATWAVQSGEREYRGPGTPEIPGLKFRKLSKPVHRPHIEIAHDTRYDTGARLTVFSPAHKRRRPIDPLVICRSGMERLTQINPELTQYADRQARHLGSYAITVALPWDVIGEFQKGVALVNRQWSPRSGAPQPLLQAPMDKETLTAQILRARQTVVAASKSPLK